MKMPRKSRLIIREIKPCQSLRSTTLPAVVDDVERGAVQLCVLLWRSSMRNALPKFHGFTLPQPWTTTEPPACSRLAVSSCTVVTEQSRIKAIHSLFSNSCKLPWPPWRVTLAVTTYALALGSTDDQVTSTRPRHLELSTISVMFASQIYAIIVVSEV